MSRSAEAQGDVLFELNGSLQVGDVSVIHPGASTFRRAAAKTAGGAAAHHSKQKRCQYGRQGFTGYVAVPGNVRPLRQTFFVKPVMISLPA
jgi:hypothetical protein